MSLPVLGAGNRLRIEQYARPLAEQGITIDVAPFFDDATYRVLYRPGATITKVAGVVRGVARRIRDAVRSRGYDLVIVYRESAALGPPLFERLLGRLGVPYVFDFDDAVFLRPIHPANQRWSWLRHPSRAPFTAAHAAAVIAGNEYLADWARTWSANVTVIPTPVDTDRHLPRPDRHTSRGPVVLGWVGSSTTSPYLRLLDRPLNMLAEGGTPRLRVIGGVYAHDAALVELLPYDLEAEPSQVADFDIGLLPEPDDPWSRGKGAFKAMLYMAAGVPVVASDIGVNREVIGEGGFCVTSDEEWVARVRELAADPELRRRMGDAGRGRIEERYSLRVQAPRLAAVLRLALGR